MAAVVPLWEVGLRKKTAIVLMLWLTGAPSLPFFLLLPAFFLLSFFSCFCSINVSTSASGITTLLWDRLKVTETNQFNTKIHFFRLHWAFAVKIQRFAPDCQFFSTLICLKVNQTVAQTHPAWLWTFFSGPWGCCLSFFTFLTLHTCAFPNWIHLEAARGQRRTW